MLAHGVDLIKLKACEIALIIAPKLDVYKPPTLVRHAKVAFVAGIPRTPHLDAHVCRQNSVWRILTSA
jgi:hypothetical protein